MAILIDAAGSERITYGVVSGTPIADMGTWTYILWTHMGTNVQSFKAFVQFRASGTNLSDPIATGGSSGSNVKLAVSVRYSSSPNVFYSTSGYPIATNSDVIIATSFDENAGANDLCRIYYGTPTSAMALQAIGYNDDNLTAADRLDDSSGELTVGDSPYATNAAAHQPSRLMVYDVRLTLAQIEAQRLCGRPLFSGCVLHSEFGRHGISTVPDLSGNGLNGTVENSPTLASHMPGIGDPFEHLAIPAGLDEAAVAGADFPFRLYYGGVA